MIQSPLHNQISGQHQFFLQSRFQWGQMLVLQFANWTVRFANGYVYRSEHISPGYSSCVWISFPTAVPDVCRIIQVNRSTRFDLPWFTGSKLSTRINDISMNTVNSYSHFQSRRRLSLLTSPESASESACVHIVLIHISRTGTSDVSLKLECLCL
ncbi:hypothetical protein BDD12DRAFT_820963 [Trichophaea hybrida]|nr:hypothetical protein BDD12DRAFT_820963 [Trichophaea hybrida]